MKKPRIGVMPLYDEEKESLWMLPGYLEGILRAGGIPLMLPLDLQAQDAPQLVEELDGLLFTGGQDVDPQLYHMSPAQVSGPFCPARDRLEQAVFAAADRADKPILGICRGLQIINVLRGGSLYQDLATEYGAPLTDHRMARPYGRRVHDARLVPGTPLHALFGGRTLGVNSCHHQAAKDLGQGLEVMARAEDGVIEALYAPQRRFLWGVQWHPEFFPADHQESGAIFRAFVETCR